MTHQRCDGSGDEDVVGVGDHDDGCGDLGEAEVDGLGLAEPAVGGDHRRPRLFGAHRRLDVAIGHHDDVELAGVPVGEDVMDLGSDALGFPVGGHEHGDGGPVFGVGDRGLRTMARRQGQPGRIEHVSGRSGGHQGADSQRGSSDHA